MPVKTHKYTNGEVTVVWKPDTCIHSRICWTNLKEVFNPSVRPWVNMDGATTERVIDQVRKCPSGALSYFFNENSVSDGENETPTVTGENATITNINVTPNGPLLINADCTITYSDGRQEIRKGKTTLCRCGASSNKPYCDGSHNRIGFTG